MGSITKPVAPYFSFAPFLFSWELFYKESQGKEERGKPMTFGERSITQSCMLAYLLSLNKPPLTI